VARDIRRIVADVLGSAAGAAEIFLSPNDHVLLVLVGWRAPKTYRDQHAQIRNRLPDVTVWVIWEPDSDRRDAYETAWRFDRIHGVQELFCKYRDETEAQGLDPVEHGFFF
jgi:hypothetical protein